MSEIISLLKINILNSINSFKSQKNSEKVGSSLVIILLAIIGIAASIYINIKLYTLFKDTPVPTFFVLIVISMALLLIIFTSFMKVKGTLFGSKDYEMLKALPVKKSSILIAKIIDIYFSEFKFALLTLLPSLVIVIMYHPTLLGILIIISAILFLPAFPILVFGIISIITHLLLSKFKYGNLVSSIVFLVIFVGVYLLIYLPSEEQQVSIFTNTADVFKYVYFPLFYIQDSLILDKLSGLLLYIGVNTLLFIIAIILFVLTYDLVNRISEAKKYRSSGEIEYKVEGVKKALIKKDFSFIFSSFQLFINSLMGPIMSIVIVFIAKTSAHIDDPEMLPKVMLIMGAVMIPMVAFMYGITPYTSFAFASDSKTFWIVKTLPLRTIDIVMPKIIVSLILTTPFAIGAGICLGFAYDLDLVTFILTPIFLIMFNLFVTILGIIFNMRKPLQNYKTETEAVKRGGSTLYMMLTSLIFLVAFGAINVLFAIFIELFLAIIIDIVISFGAFIGAVLILQNNMDKWYYNLYN